MTTRASDIDRLVALDRAHVWHPFTQMADWLADDDPLIIERAEGNHLIDVRGRRYLDGVSSLWVTVHGHRRAEIDNAIRAQLDRVAHSTLLGLGNVPSIELAGRLVHVAPDGLTKVFYSDSGSTAVEVALKIAYQYWQHRGQPAKRQFVALAESYHGDTIGSVSVGGIDLFHQIFHTLLFQVHRVPTPYSYRSPSPDDPRACVSMCLQSLDKLLSSQAHEIAAFVLEPRVQGAAGMLMQPPGYLPQVAELCRKHDVLLICDEVATGFGRTGAMFACDLEGVRPDLMTVAKGLTGGYLPLAATLATDAVYDAFLGPHASKRTFFHGHTYTGNPLACAAAIASLDIFERDRTIDAIQPRITELATLLARDIAPLAHVGEVRQQGLMVGIELVTDRETRGEYPYEAAIGARVCREARKHGVILRPLGPVVVLMPPLSITTSELAELVEATRRSIIAITA
ncbi:MAG: adenosylmethionine--8-amino-7-oxononanoate transaminase [Deltaproteobacteria bacterium]|nr:adenosylmethionine--8-amino-7-oxononanoate transaminase [Deltaproteobacteria bacterium]